MTEQRQSIGAVAKETGCNIETIRYYEKEALLPPPGRSPGGHRLYTQTQVQRLIFIRRSREVGFSLDEVRQLLTLVDGHEVSCERVKQIADMHLADVETKIEDLQKISRSLQVISAECSGTDIPDCPIIETLLR